MKYPLSPDVKPEFCTTGSFMRLPSSRENAKLAVVGMPFDTAASFRVGARFAPQAVRQASMTLFPYHPIHKVFPFDECNAIDIGDVSVIPHNIHRSYEIIEKAMGDLMKNGIIPIGIGGDHSVTLANLRAAAKYTVLLHFFILIHIQIPGILIMMKNIGMVPRLSVHMRKACSKRIKFSKLASEARSIIQEI